MAKHAAAPTHSGDQHSALERAMAARERGDVVAARIWANAAAHHPSPENEAVARKLAPALFAEPDKASAAAVAEEIRLRTITPPRLMLYGLGVVAAFIFLLMWSRQYA